MIFDCKASLSLPNTTLRFSRAKIAVAGHNGVHYIIVSFPSSRERLCIANITSIHSNNKMTSATVNFTKPCKTLTIDASDSGVNLIGNFSRTISSLRRGDKKIKEAVPSIDYYDDKMLRHRPKTYVVEGNEYDIRAFANNSLEKVMFNKTTSLLPKGIFRLEFLKELHLTNCGLEEIPERIVSLKGTLSTLNLSNNKIRKIDAKMLCCLRQLSLLNISHNTIQVLPLELVFLRNLSVLDVSFNFISRIPFTIGLLNKLRVLNLSHNILQYFPQSILSPPLMAIKLQRLRLDSLDLSGNNPVSSFRETGTSLETSKPPSLLQLASRMTIRATFALKMIQEWLPYTVYDYLQENSCICSSCHGPSVASDSIITSLSGHYSLLSNTVVSDTSTLTLPVVSFICPVCRLK